MTPAPLHHRVRWAIAGWLLHGYRDEVARHQRAIADLSAEYRRQCEQHVQQAVAVALLTEHRKRETA